jgi:hypothetical protein
MAIYLDPKNDLVFKRIFGSHPGLLKSFLNALMPFEPGRVMKASNTYPTSLCRTIRQRNSQISSAKKYLK